VDLNDSLNCSPEAVQFEFVVVGRVREPLVVVAVAAAGAI